MDEIEAGEILRAKREETNMSRAEVADKLNVSEDTIRKLEDGEHEQLRGRVFVRGYIRYYAKLLNVDISELLEEKNEVVLDVADDLDYMQNETTLRHTRIWGSIVVLTALAFVVYSWWLESKPPLLTPTAPPPTEAEEPSFSPPDAPLDSPAMEEVQSSPETWPPAESPVESPTESPAESPTESHAEPQTQWAAPTTPTMPSEPVEFTEPTATEAPANESTGQTVLDAFVEVQLETGDHESWVQITDADGDLLLERLLGPFSQARVYGTAPFNFRIGYVGGVTLSIDGELYPFLRHESRGMAIFVAP